MIIDGTSPYDTPPFVWTEEREADLRRMLSEGHTASSIAAAWGLKSRGPVCGKIHRLGLSSPRKPGRIAAPKLAAPTPEAPAPAPKPPAKRKRAVVTNPEFCAAREKIEQRAAKVFAPVPGGVPFMNLRAGHCRFPSGDGEAMRFCGAAPLAGKPYCAAHARIAYIPPRRRDDAPAATPV